MRRGYNAVMRTISAVVGGVLDRGLRRHFDDHLEVSFLTERNVRIMNSFKLDCRDGSGRSCLTIEAEHQFLIRAADLGSSFSRLCGF